VTVVVGAQHPSRRRRQGAEQADDKVVPRAARAGRTRELKWKVHGRFGSDDEQQGMTSNKADFKRQLDGWPRRAGASVRRSEIGKTRSDEPRSFAA